MSLKGSCLCGAIRFEAQGTPRRATACHCRECRRQSGHFWASACVPSDHLTVEGKPRWFASSQQARRGFCPACGSFLFWERAGEGMTSFALGAIDGASGLTLQKHIFVAEKGDYYDIADGVVQE